MRAYSQSDNIVPLWRVVIPNIVSESYPYLDMSIEFSNVKSIVKSDSSVRTNYVLCSRALKKESSLE